MDQLLQGFLNVQQVTLSSLIIVLVIGTMLCLFIAVVYRTCMRGASYSQDFLHTIILMGIIVSVIMLVIGSNIARAFSLVGALSIIRFRTAIKNPMDVGYLFFAMAVGMACGTQFYGIAIVSTFFISAVIFLLNRFNFGSRATSEHFLEIQFLAASDPATLMADCLNRFTLRSSCNRIETVMGGALLEASYTLQLKPGASEKEFLDALRQINGNNKVRLIFKSPGFEI
jgi:hypothetical protein